MGKPKSKPNAALPTHLSSNKHGVPSVSASSPAVIALRGNGKSTGKSPRPQLQTQTQTDTMVVTEFQSLQLVRTVITATISNIIWTRKIFPRNLFVCRMYNLNDPEVSYDHFMSGKGRFGSQAGDDGIVWRVFQPNVHAGMDKVLKWLNVGVADALEKKFLASVQFSIYKSEVSMDTLIEAYIITIAYEEGVPALQISKKSRSSGSKNAEETTTLFVAKDGIHKLVDNILTDAGQLNSLTGNLPEDCLINLHLVYTQDSPANYNAPGFYEGDTTLLVKPEEVSTSAFKTQTGFHAITARIFNRERQDRHPPDSPANSAPSAHPTLLSKLPTPLPSSQQTQQSALQAFKPIGETRDPHAETQDTQLVLLDGTPKSTLTTHSVSGKSQSASIPSPVYTQALRSWIDRAKKTRDAASADSLDPDDLDELGNGLTSAPDPRVKCECGDQEREERMLNCDICSGAKHYTCYGYLTPKDISEFICYDCLLVREQSLRQEMRDLCVVRRALSKFLEAELVDLTTLLNTTSIVELVGHEIIDRLRKENVVRDAAPALKRSKKGKEKAQLSSFEVDIEKLREIYFQPRYNIEHHLALQDESSISSNHTITASWQELEQSPSMQTPHSNQGRKRGADNELVSSQKVPKLTGISSPWGLRK